MWVTESTCQKRVVARDMLREGFVSIPVDYPIHVKTLDKEGQGKNCSSNSENTSLTTTCRMINLVIPNWPK